MPQIIPPPPIRGKKLTQHQKIVKLMCQENRWYFPYEFMRPELGDLFVGYEASARLSELAREYPEAFESEKDGKYVKRRLNRATIQKWFSGLSKDLRQVVAKELNYYPHIPTED